MSTIRSLLLGTFLLALAGCFPGVAWLPDSSGFYYTTGMKGGQLNFFDVKTKKVRVVAEDTKTNCMWPGVSSDGKRIALINLITNRDPAGKGQTMTMEVVIVDANGKEQKRTKPLPWATIEGGGGPDLLPSLPQVFWIPKTEKLLIGDTNATGIFDLTNDSLNKLDETMLLCYGGTPLRPDGQGFLALKGAKDKKKEPPSFTAFDFAGKVIGTATLEGFKEDPNDKAGLGKILVLAAPEGTGSSWTKEGAMASWGGNKLVIDFAKKSAKLEEGKPMMTDDGRPILHTFSLKEGVGVRVVELPKNMDPKVMEIFPPTRVELVTGGKAKLLVDKTDLCVFLPSPDRQTFALRCGNIGEAAQDLILVLNAQGEVLAALRGKQ